MDDVKVKKSQLVNKWMDTTPYTPAAGYRQLKIKSLMKLDLDTLMFIDAWLVKR